VGAEWTPVVAGKLIGLRDHPGNGTRLRCAALPRPVRQGSGLVKKGRHRRFEEARSLKRAVEGGHRRCPECGASGEDEHASWCEAEADEFEEMLGSVNGHERVEEDDPLAGS
jgi:hypothetical protein